MKKSRLLTILLLVIVAVLGVAFIACEGNPEPLPEPPGTQEVGVYYYDYDGAEYLLTLNDGSMSLIMGNTVVSGAYVRSGSNIEFAYMTADGAATLTAKLSEDYSKVTLTYNSLPMTFLRRTEYTVTFDTDSGSNVAAVKVLNGKTVGKPSDPTKSGYTFIGWFKDADHTTPFIFDSDIIGSNVTLYAQWVETVFGVNVYTVKFDVGDYEGAVDPEPKQTVGGKLYGLTSPSRAGYEFVGWWYSVTGNADELTHRVDADTVYNENTTLYAVWRGAREGNKLVAPVVDVTEKGVSWESVADARQYHLQITGPDGFTAIDRRQTLTECTVDFSIAGSYTITVTAESLSADGDSDATVRKYNHNPLARVSLFDVIDSNTLLWNAVDGAERYLVDIVCGNPAHNHNPFDNGASTYYNFSNCEMRKDADGDADKDGIIFTVTAVADGHTSSVSEKYYYNKALAAIPGLFYDEENQTVSWQSVPGATGYTVTVDCGTQGHDHTDLDIGNKTSFDLKECSVVDGALEVSVTPHTKGYNSPDATKLVISAEQKSGPIAPYDIRIIESTLSWANVDADEYVVRIGGKEIKCTTNSLDLAVQDITWTKGSDYDLYVRAYKGGKASAWSDAVDARYYAMYSTLAYGKNTVSWRHVIGAKGYDVRVNGNDGGIVRVTNGTNSARVTLTKAGDNKIEVRFFNDEETSNWAPITVKAYALAFDTRGGETVGDVTQYYAVGDEITLPSATDITKVGYTLGELYNSPNGAEGNGARFTDKFFSAAGDMMLYATWVPKTYKLTLNYNNGGTGITEAEVTFGKPFKLPTPETITDGTTIFGGWCANSLGTAALYTDEEGNSVVNWTTPGDIEVYARWLSVFKYEKSAGGSAGFYYTVQSGVATREVTSATIPAMYTAPGETTAYPVTTIGEKAFSCCTGIQVINLPSTIDTILPRAFETYSTLRTINVEKDNTTFFSIDGVLYYNNGTTGEVDLWGVPRALNAKTLTLSSRLNNIPTRAFYYVYADELEIPASVTYIANEAFYYSKIPVVKFLSPAEDENALTLRLEIGAFTSATVMTDITLPARSFTVWDVSAEAPVQNPDFNTQVFASCSALTNIYVDKNNNLFQGIDGMLCTKGADATLLFCPNDRAGKMTIPLGIVKIGRRAFSNCRNITELEIPNWVTEIEEEAFTGYKVRLPGASYDTTVWGCNGITKITFKGGDGVAADLVIGKNAFGNKTETTSYFCSKLDTIVFEEGSGVTEIGEYAFARCPITSITLPVSLTELKEGVFYGCDKLVTVAYAPGGKDISIGDQVFANCTSFTTVQLPANITEFNDGVFAGCNNLSTVEVDPANPVLASVDGVLFDKQITEIKFYPFGKEGNYEIPGTVTKISGGAFADKSNVTSITIGKNVTYIGAGAFRHCVNLETVIFEDGGTVDLEIGESAFNGCVNLTTFSLPNRVKKIPARMLFFASKLTDVTIPDSVESIGSFAFYFVGGSASKNAAAIDKIIVPSSVKEIGIAAFSKCYAKEIEFENKESGDLIIEVAEAAITSNYNNSWLDTYNPISMNKDASNLFFGCYYLEKVTLPNGLKTMPAGMFESCSKLTEVTIPGTVNEMGFVFMNCSSLVTVTFAERPIGEDGKIVPLVMSDGSDSTTSTGGAPTHTYYGVFAGCRSLKNITLPEGLTRIPDYCFFNCDSLESIHIPASVQNGQYTVGSTQLTAIGKKAFASGVIGQDSSGNTAPTMKLSSVTFAPGGTGDFSIGDDSFKSCSRLTSVTLPARLADVYVTANGKDWKVCGVRVGYQNNTSSYSYTTPSFGAGITEINVEAGGKYYASVDGVLYTADLTELVYVPAARTKDVTVPASVELVRNFALYQNKGVKKVTFLNRDNANVATQAEGEDEEEPALPKGLVIGEDAQINSAGAFYFSNVEEVYLPKQLSAITSYAFYGCKYLRKLEFAEGTDRFTEIGRDAFNTSISGIASFMSITLPDSVTTIGDRAFRGNSKLATFTISQNSKLSKIGSEAFYGTAIQEFYLPPAESFELGAGAFSNCSKLTTVHVPNTVSSFDGLFSGSYAISTLDIYAVTNENGEAVQGSLMSDNGVIYVDGGKTLSYYPIGKKDTSYTIPVGVTKIAASAFMNNGYLQEVYIPNTVELILDKAFYMMPALKKVVFEKDDVVRYVQIAEGETYTGDKYVKNGEEYVLDNENGTYKLLSAAPALKIGVTVNATTGAVTNSTGATGTGVFSFCQSLEVVNFPARLEHISGYSFYYCVKLHTVTFDTNCRLGIMQKCVFSNTSLQYGGTREQIAENAKHAFVLPPNLTEFVAGSTTADENRNTFGKVTKLVIPASVTKVGNYAFHGSQYLEEVEFTGSTETALTTGTSMFKLCSNLKKVTIPNKITTIPSSTFEDCHSLTNVYFGSQAEGQTVTGVITIPSDITKVDGSAFKNCKSITKVVLPTSGLTTINNFAFFGCTNLAKITSDATNTEYDLYLPTCVTTLAASAFAGTSIETAYIPSSVTSFAAVFNYNAKYLDGTRVICEKLKKVVFQSDENNTKLTSLPSDMFMYLEALEEVVLPTNSKFVTINADAFAWSGLKRITIPANITKINQGAFAYCSRLEKVEFAESSTALTIAGGTYNAPTVYTTSTSSYWSSYNYLGVFVHSGEGNGRAEAKAKAEAADATDEVKAAYAANFVIDMSKRKITAINKWSFYDTMNLDVKLSEETTSIETQAFQNAYFDEVVIPAKTTTIKIAAFAKSKIKAIKFAAATTAVTIAAGTSTNTDTTLGAFAYCDELKSVDMSERKITALPKYAFYRCPSIEKIKWSVNQAATEDEPMTTHTATIGEAAFQYSFNIAKLDIPRGVVTIDKWSFWGDTIGEVKLPNTLTTLGYGSFYEVSTLAKVEFEAGSSITAFKNQSGGTDGQVWTFGYNPDLKTVVLPDSLTLIGANAFYKTGLTSVTIPKSVVTIGNYAFGTNPDLKTITFAKDEDGNCALTTFGEGAFNNTGITTISIPKSATSVSAYMFGGCSALASITFEKDGDGNCAVASIGRNAFVSTALQSISIPKSVAAIDMYAFSNVKALTSVTLEKNDDGECALTTIGAGAFNGTGITSFVIPASVTSLNANPFRYCASLASLTIEDGNDTFVCENNVVYNNDKSILLIYAAGIDGAFEIPESVVEIGNYAFAGSKWAGALNIALNGFTVGESAFEACGITSVTLSSGVSVGRWAFGDSPELTSVTIGTNAEIGESAFENCQKLSSVTIGSGATIGNQAFADDAALTEFTLPQGATVGITAFVGSGVTLDEEMLQDDTTLKYGELDAYIDGTIVFDTVADAVAALKNYSDLEYVELAEGVTTIGNNAFDGIANLKKIILPSTLVSIGSYAFRNCTSLEEVVFKRDADGNCSLEEIGMYSFQKTALVNVVIPKSVVKFRYYAFYQCPELTKVEFEAGSAITVYYANLASGIGTTVDARHFADCPKLETVILPDHATSIPATMFENSGIKYISIPATVTGIWQNAFLNCASLETVTFEKNEDGSTAITTINKGAFMNSGIKSISVPATVKTFAENVFKNCAALTTVTFEKDANGDAALTTLGTYMFEGTSVTSIAIPRLVTAIPVNAFYGVSALEEVSFEKDADGNCALTAINKLAFAGTGIKQISIPCLVTTIGGETTDGKDPGGAFYNCASLASVTFEKNEEGTSALKYIYAYAFAGTAITQIALPATSGTSSYSIYYNAFSDCANLTSVTWELDAEGNSGTVSIYTKAFENCPKLKNFIIGNRVKPYNDAFNGWGSDMTIYVVGLPGPNTSWSMYRWLTNCEAKWVWYWSEDMGFLNANGEFENAAA